MNPDTGRFEPISDELMKKFADPAAQLTETEQKQRNWTRFEIGETVVLKGIKFTVHNVGPTSLILHPVVKERD